MTPALRFLYKTDKPTRHLKPGMPLEGHCREVNGRNLCALLWAAVSAGYSKDTCLEWQRATVISQLLSFRLMSLEDAGPETTRRRGLCVDASTRARNNRRCARRLDVDNQGPEVYASRDHGPNGLVTHFRGIASIGAWIQQRTPRFERVFM